MKLENNRDTLYALQSLLSIPHKILSRDDIDNITEFVLHDLCHNECLNLDRAAYFVDNPDFNHFKGVAGIDRNEEQKRQYPIWEDSKQFSLDMRDSPFNNKVKHVFKESPQRLQKKDSDFADLLAQDLSLHDHSYHVWDMKHGNRGFFMYQPSCGHSKELSDLVANSVCFLGFCPLF